MKELTINDFEFEGMCPDGKRFIWEQTQGQPFDPKRLARRYCEEGGQAYALAYVIMLWCVRYKINAGEWLDRLLVAAEAIKAASSIRTFETRKMSAAIQLAQREAWSAIDAQGNVELINQTASNAESVAYWLEAIIGTDRLKEILLETIDNLSES